jgi:hypothetical protein
LPYQQPQQAVQKENEMKKLTMKMIEVQKYLTPNKMRIAMFGFALVLAAAAPGRFSINDFNAGGCGGG